MATYNIHAGHCPNGQGASGAVGLISESTEARAVKNEVMSMLKSLGHTVYDCTCDENTSQSGCLTKIVSKCNEHSADLDISIHFNAGRNDSVGDGKNAGTEVYVYNTDSKAKETAASICKSIADLGYTNRGVKYSTSLYVLKKTKSPALLVECCFVDDADDIKLYNARTMAAAIVKGITGKDMIKEGEIYYDAYAHGTGWTGMVADGMIAGTTGQAKQMEILRVNANGKKLKMRVHLSGSGWGKLETSTGCIEAGKKGATIEAVRIKGVGYKVKYRVHMSGIGWGPWRQQGKVAGTTGQSRAIEAIQIKVV